MDKVTWALQLNHAKREFEAIWRRHRPTAVLALLLATTLIGTATPADSGPSEYDVKAAYLFNFGKFVKWPATPTQPPRTSFLICVLGQDHFGGALDKVVAGERINRLPVTVKHVNAVDEAASCQILFIDGSEQRRLSSLLSKLNPGVLTVSDMPGFLDRGGMIEFQLVNDRVRFEVNLSAAEKSGLSLSSDLLKVAVRVTRAGA
jgi:uncharacterized protein DUF4154